MFKYLFFSFFILLLDPTPKIEWLTPIEMDLGDIKQHEPETFVFQYKNVSTDTLLIDVVRTTCNCTASEWEEQPVEPDSLGHIKITYDAKKKGYFRKKIKVFFQGQKKAEKLAISGWVE